MKEGKNMKEQNAWVAVAVVVIVTIVAGYFYMFTDRNALLEPSGSEENIVECLSFEEPGGSISGTNPPYKRLGPEGDCGLYSFASANYRKFRNIISLQTYYDAMYYCATEMGYYPVLSSGGFYYIEDMIFCKKIVLRNLGFTEKFTSSKGPITCPPYKDGDNIVLTTNSDQVGHAVDCDVSCAPVTPVKLSCRDRYASGNPYDYDLTLSNDGKKVVSNSNGNYLVGNNVLGAVIIG